MAASWPTMFRQAPVSTLVTEGARHVVRYANPEFCRFAGVEPDQLLGRPITEVMPASLGGASGALLDEVHHRRAPGSRVSRDATAERAASWLIVAWPVADRASHTAVQLTQLPTNGVPKAQYEEALEEIRAINSQLVVSNVRAQELLEEAETASRAKDNFLAMLAHELRNPLSPIRNSVEILRQIDLEPLAVEAREMIARQTSHVTRLVDDLLDLSRLAHGKIALRMEPLDIVRVARLVVDDYRIACEHGQLALTMLLPAHPLWVRGDPTRFAQVVGNLIDNAIKFTEPRGQICVHVTAEEQAAVVSVRDTGIGMEPQMLKGAFDLFNQADASLARRRGGLGIGLSLAQELVRQHGGEIHAASEGLGKGCEVTVRMPLTDPPDESSARSHAAAERPPAGARILVVEDNIDAAESLRVLMQLRGHRVEVVHSGAEALTVAQTFHPEIVLCDIGLPGDLDGYAVARALRDDPRIMPTQMIAVSGYGRSEDIRLSHEAGFDHHLTKPLDLQRLNELLAQRA